ncbi:putative disease resistance RPP13-like protein 1 [Beta vulgaris subsp. vulgaris]|uniref:putative disease resistance RPP13-like protein 1 n=1 Tax=Beta vulgaris subsp. vulgaris TaxID=3555 RepID=UPI0020371B98|nr:putative disease resistance RPP13-like protein 1 [Beta vulgaris subsp. vulgaris]
MEWYISIAASLLKILSQKLVDLASTEISYIRKVDENLRSLITSSERVQHKLNQLHDDARFKVHLREWLRDVTKLFYEVDDIIDGISLDIMKENHIINQQQQLAIIKEQECRSFFYLMLQRSISRRSNAAANHRHPNTEIETQFRRSKLASLKKWRLPRNIKALKDKLKKIDREVDGLFQAAATSNRGNSSSTAAYSSSHPQGPLARAREEDNRTIMQKYLLNPSFTGKGVCIIGMSGLGKTTLARFIQNDARIREEFVSVKWASVPDDFNSTSRIIVEPCMDCHVAYGYPVTGPPQKGRTLLVLDDMWNVHHMAWSTLLSNQNSETIFLITTRDPMVASVTATTPYYINRLSDKDCRELILEGLDACLGSLSGRYIHSISEIAKKCAGLPLVAKWFSLAITAGCLLQGSEAAISHFQETDLWDLREFPDQILPRLRFNDPVMPPELSKFLAYLYLFPNDYYYKKDELSQLWIAEGFVTPEEWTTLGLKNAGQHFDDLLSRSMLHVSHYSTEEDKMTTCKIHEFTHRFAKSLASNLSHHQMKDDGDRPFLPTKPVHHLSLCYQNIEPHHLKVIEAFYTHLRTFLLLPKQRANLSEVPESLFHKLRSLRVLSLNRSLIHTLPRSVCKLVHLRYLDASDTPIQSLPETTCELLGLRVIKLRYCPNLLQLPSRISNLVNLIRLDVDINNLRSTPPYIGRLTNLQALDAYIVKNREGYRITELGNMNRIRGSIKIMELENVQYSGEAENAKLRLKPHLKKLELHWTDTTMRVPSMVRILNMLQPHNNLTELRLTNYSGAAFPSWLCSSSCHLKVIRLYNCSYITELPTFWKLPLLQTLSIDTARGLVQLGRQFFGDVNHSRFPHLELLELQNMPGLTRWEGLKPGDMPHLRELRFVNCPALSVLSTLRHLTSLKNLEIVNCPNLETEPDLPMGVDSYNF